MPVVASVFQIGISNSINARVIRSSSIPVEAVVCQVFKDKKPLLQLPLRCPTTQEHLFADQKVFSTSGDLKEI